MGSVPSSQIQNKEEGSTFGSEYVSHGEIRLQKHVYRAAEDVLQQPLVKLFNRPIIFPEPLKPN